MKIGQMRIFQKVASGVLILFSAIMVFVTIAAYSRRSGATRQDMAEAHFLRENHRQSVPLQFSNEP